MSAFGKRSIASTLNHFSSASSSTPSPHALCFVLVLLSEDHNCIIFSFFCKDFSSGSTSYKMSSVSSGTSTALTSSSMSSYNGTESSHVERAKHMAFSFFAQLQLSRPFPVRSILVSFIQMLQLYSLCIPSRKFFQAWGDADVYFFEWVRLARTIGVDRGKKISGTKTTLPYSLIQPHPLL